MCIGSIRISVFQVNLKEERFFFTVSFASFILRNWPAYSTGRKTRQGVCDSFFARKKLSKTFFLYDSSRGFLCQIILDEKKIKKQRAIEI